MVSHTSFHYARPRGALSPIALAVALIGAGGSAVYANPMGGVAIHGQASMVSNGNQLTVTTQNGAGTNYSAINWQSFSIPAGSTTQIVQPSAASLSINRVVTNTPSLLFGTLSSNGQVVLVNQAGIAVGAGALVDTAGFTASAVGMTTQDALAGRLRFAGDGISTTAGALTVQGNIIARGGDVVLIAPSIDIAQTAVVEAQGGSVVLAAGQSVEVTGRGLEGITLQVQAPTDQAMNLGTLRGDAVGIFAGTLKHSGLIQATQASLEGGRVVLKASGDAVVEGSGKLLASGTKGGSVDVLGQRVALLDQATIDVSGEYGGGSVRVGGDYQGLNPDIPNASLTYFGQQASIRADASIKGDGGKVIIWADDTTRAYGTISAKGGAQGGNGGFIENSGHRYLDFQGHTDTSATIGNAGTLLLDPQDIHIIGGTVDTLGDATWASGTLSGGTVNPQITWNTINGQTGNVEIRTNSGSTSGLGDIYLDASGTLTGPTTLTLLANRGINIQGGVVLNAGSADVNLVAGWNNTGFAVSPGANNNITFGVGSSVSTTGNVWLNAGNQVAGANGTITANILTIGNTNGGSLPGGVNLSGTNMVNTLAVYSDGGGGLTFNNGKALSIGAGAFSINGIIASGNPSAINISTSVGNLTVNKAILSDAVGGAPITLTASTGAIVLNDNITTTSNATLAGPVKLVAGSGGISGTGAIVADGLEIASAGSVTLNGAHNINTLAANVTGVTGPGLNFSSPTAYAVGVVGGTSGVSVTNGDAVLKTAGTNQLLTLNQGVQAINGNVTLVADNLALNASTNSSTAAGKYVEIKPYTASTTIDLANAADAAGVLRLTGAELNQITTPLLKLGNSAVTGNITFNQAFAPTNFTTMSAITSGTISQSAGATISIANLNADGAAGVSLTETNAVGTLAGHTAAGNFAFTNGGALSVGAVDIITGVVSDSGGNITLTSGSNISLGVVKSSGSVSVTSSGGAILDTNGASTNIVAGNATLSAYSGIGSSDAIEVQAGSLSASNSMVNDIVLDVSGSVSLGTMTPASTGRWLIYASDPSSVTPGTVLANFSRYGATYATYPNPTETGNGFIYASAPAGVIAPANLVSTFLDNFEIALQAQEEKKDDKDRLQDALVVEGEICKP